MDYDLDLVLSLDGEIFMYDDGTFVKFKFKKVNLSDEIPHGISYSLTYHNKDKQRILGYDNAHFPQNIRNKYKKSGLAFDHKHRSENDEGILYDFVDFVTLFEDFQRDVKRLRNE
jgi:Family of unknown function (DUF6516)